MFRIGNHKTRLRFQIRKKIFIYFLGTPFGTGMVLLVFFIYRTGVPRFYGMVPSVADPGCLSRIPDPDFYPSRIPDPGSKNSNKERGEKKFDVIPFYVATNFTKLYIILVLKF
jgi:hypothetical protein